MENHITVKKTKTWKESHTSGIVGQNHFSQEMLMSNSGLFQVVFPSWAHRLNGQKSNQWVYFTVMKCKWLSYFPTKIGYIDMHSKFLFIFHQNRYIRIKCYSRHLHTTVYILLHWYSWMNNSTCKCLCYIRVSKQFSLCCKPIDWVCFKMNSPRS